MERDWPRNWPYSDSKRSLYAYTVYYKLLLSKRHDLAHPHVVNPHFLNHLLHSYNRFACIYPCFFYHLQPVRYMPITSNHYSFSLHVQQFQRPPRFPLKTVSDVEFDWGYHYKYVMKTTLTASQVLFHFRFSRSHS